jgi:hypothetical protein
MMNERLRSLLPDCMGLNPLCNLKHHLLALSEQHYTCAGFRKSTLANESDTSSTHIYRETNLLRTFLSRHSRFFPQPTLASAYTYSHLQFSIRLSPVLSPHQRPAMRPSPSPCRNSMCSTLFSVTLNTHNSGPRSIAMTCMPIWSPMSRALKS